MAFFGFLTIVGAVLGGVVLVLGVFSASGAPQQAAAAAVAVALGVLPYVIFRVLQSGKRDADLAAIRQEISRSGGASAPRVHSPTPVTPLVPARPPQAGRKEWILLALGALVLVAVGVWAKFYGVR